MSNFETLKARCHWKEREQDLDEDGKEFVKEVRNLISQVSTFRAGRDKYKALAENLERSLEKSEELIQHLLREDSK